MTRIVNYAERNGQVSPPRVLTIGAAAAVVVFEDDRKSRKECAKRSFQNTGANPLFYSFGVVDAANPAAGVCNATDMYHGSAVAGGVVNCSDHRNIVTVYSPIGTTVATTYVERLDMTHHN